MNWKAKYEKITDISQLKVGDFISYFSKFAEKRRYGIITDLSKDTIYAVWEETKEEALRPLSSCSYITNLKTIDLRFENV